MVLASQRCLERPRVRQIIWDFPTTLTREMRQYWPRNHSMANPPAITLLRSNHKQRKSQTAADSSCDNCHFGLFLNIKEIWLVVSIPLKHMSSSDWIIIPAIGENNKHVPNHQVIHNEMLFSCTHVDIYSISVFSGETMVKPHHGLRIESSPDHGGSGRSGTTGVPGSWRWTQPSPGPFSQRFCRNFVETLCSWFFFLVFSYEASNQNCQAIFPSKCHNPKKWAKHLVKHQRTLGSFEELFRLAVRLNCVELIALPSGKLT